MIYPEPLKTGDTVGIVSPSGPVDKEVVHRGIKFLEELGLKVKRGKGLFLKKQYLAGEDHERAKDLMDMFKDEEVRAIISSRGGYGCIRMIKYIDFELVKNNPKIFLGYSDISILLNNFCKKAGIVTFHGPMLRQISEQDKLTVNVFRQLLFGETEVLTYKTPELKTVHRGEARGMLIGGCLSVILSTLGTDYEPPWDDSILFFEDVDEPLYRIDRMLTQLKLSGRLKKIRGLIAGKIKGLKRDELASLLKETLEENPLPCVVNFPAGHQLPNLTLPIGARVHLNADAPSVTVELHG
jgi:muramoyltetrapeptide carboxypeptidase